MKSLFSFFDFFIRPKYYCLIGGLDAIGDNLSVGLKGAKKVVLLHSVSVTRIILQTLGAANGLHEVRPFSSRFDLAKRPPVSSGATFHSIMSICVGFTNGGQLVIDHSGGEDSFRGLAIDNEGRLIAGGSASELIVYRIWN